MAGVIFIGSDHDVELNSLAHGGTALTSATVTYALYDSTGAAVSGGSGTLTGDGAGNYAGTIESTATATLADGAKYTIRFVAVQSPYDHRWDLPLYAAVDGG